MYLPPFLYQLISKNLYLACAFHKKTLIREEMYQLVFLRLVDVVSTDTWAKYYGTLPVLHKVSSIVSKFIASLLAVRWRCGKVTLYECRVGGGDGVFSFSSGE